MPVIPIIIVAGSILAYGHWARKKQRAGGRTLQLSATGEISEGAVEETLRVGERLRVATQGNIPQGLRWEAHVKSMPGFPHNVVRVAPQTSQRVLFVITANIPGSAMVSFDLVNALGQVHTHENLAIEVR